MVSLMTEVKLILNTHIAYFRLHPWLLLLFIIGLSLGSALLTAITGLNQEAKNRHQKSSALMDASVSHIVKPPIGQKYIDGKLWLKLREQGYTNAQPVLRGKLKLASGKTLYLQGIDSLIWLAKPTSENKSHSISNSANSSNSHAAFTFDSIMIDSSNLNNTKSLTAGTNNKLQLANSAYAPSFSLVDDIGMWSVTDLAYADLLLGANGQLSFY